MTSKQCGHCGSIWDAPVSACPNDDCLSNQVKQVSRRSPAQLFDDALRRFECEARDAFSNAEAFKLDGDDLPLGELIKTQRAALRLSLEEFGKRGGFTKSHAWELENGRSANPTVRTVQSVASALGLPSTVVFRAALKVTEFPP